MKSGLEWLLNSLWLTARNARFCNMWSLFLADTPALLHAVIFFNLLFSAISQPVLQLDLWLRYVTFNLTNKWGFPCCIYDPTVVEIHQSMWKFEPNVKTFFTTTENRQLQSGQSVSDPYVSFLLSQATQKKNAIRSGLPPGGLLSPKSYMDVPVDLENLTFSIPIFCLIYHPSVYHFRKKSTQFCPNWMLFTIICPKYTQSM